MYDAIYAVTGAFLLGQSVLVLSIICLRKDRFGVYFPLGLFFLANAVNQIPSILEPYRSNYLLEIIAIFSDMLSIPTFLMLGPALWLYVRQLTSKQAKLLSATDLRHFIPAFAALFIVLSLTIAPVNIRASLFGKTEIEYGGLVVFFKVAIFTLMNVWGLQVILYARLCVKRLALYRRQLKDNFANTEGKDLKWLNTFMLIVVLSVLVLVPDFLFGFPDYFVFLPIFCDVILFWFIAIYGLSQSPVWQGVESSCDESNRVPSTRTCTKQPSIVKESISLQEQSTLQKNATNTNETSTTEKYAKSALTTDDMQRIAGKLKTAIANDKIYLNNNLTLVVLASHIQVPSNYVSQTLNSYLSVSFFDFINNARIKFALPLLIKSEQTVLEIAYASGFNSRSSFYTAFKKALEMTPKEYIHSNKYKQ